MLSHLGRKVVRVIQEQDNNPRVEVCLLKGFYVLCCRYKRSVFMPSTAVTIFGYVSSDLYSSRQWGLMGTVSGRSPLAYPPSLLRSLLLKLLSIFLHIRYYISILISKFESFVLWHSIVCLHFTGTRVVDS